MTEPVAPGGTARLVRAAPAVATGLAAAVLGFLPEAATRIAWFVDSGALLAGVALLLGAASLAAVLVRALRGPDGRAVAREAAVALAVAAALVVALRLLVPVTMRTQVDEAWLAGVAYGLWLDGSPVLPADALFGPGGRIEPLHVLADVRGLGYPLLTALVHAVAGYAPDNGLWLNGVLGTLALLATYAVARAFAPPAVALASLPLFCAFPAAAMSFASGSFEPANLAFVATAVALVLHARRTPDDVALAAALLSVPVLALGRYESVLLGAAILGWALLPVCRARSALPAAALALVPPLLLPFAWQRAIAIDFSPGQLGEATAFGVDHFAANLVHALEFLVVPSAIHPTAPFAALGAAVPVVAWAANRRTRGATVDPALAWLAFGFVAMLVVVLAFVWGDVRRAVTLRYTLPFLMALSIAAAVGYGTLLRRTRHAGVATLAAAGAALAASTPAIRADVVWNAQFAAPSVQAARDFVRSVAPRCRPLFVTPVGAYFVLHGHDSVAPVELQRDWARFRNRAAQGLAGPVLVVAMTDASGARWEASSPPPGFEARPVFAAPAGAGTVDVYSVDRADAPLPPASPDCAALSPPAGRVE